MPINNIYLGVTDNDGTGDSAKLAGQKINANFAYFEGLITASGLKTYLVEGYPFMWKKGRSNAGVINTATSMEQYDIILFGFCDVGGDNTLVKLAQYDTGDPTLITSYNIIESI